VHLIKESAGQKQDASDKEADKNGHYHKGKGQTCRIDSQMNPFFKHKAPDADHTGHIRTII